MGISQRGSYVVQVKNPTVSGPPNVTIKNTAEYPKAIMEEKFGDYRWIPLEPELLDYDNTQLLIIGEKHPHETAEMQKLEDEVFFPPIISLSMPANNDRIHSASISSKKMTLSLWILA